MVYEGNTRTMYYPSNTNTTDASIYTDIPLTFLEYPQYTGYYWPTYQLVQTIFIQPTQAELDEAKAEEEARNAENKAKELLEDWLGKEGLAKLYKVGYIEVDSQKYQGRKYRVPQAHMGYIEVIENNKVIDTLCVHPAIQCPPSDHIFSRLVLLKYSEEYLLSKSNRRGRLPEISR